MRNIADVNITQGKSQMTLTGFTYHTWALTMTPWGV